MPQTNSPAKLQIFKPGTHTAMSGQALSFSEADLQATAAAYDPAKHEAPLVVGHPQLDMPAYGWVQALHYSDGAMDATPAQVNAEFADLVAAGAFKKISASFYAPNSPSNPVPGVYYLRHVGFLGAAAPAVKGMRAPSFADAEEGVIEFSEWDDATNANLWRNLREWMIGTHGADVADKVLPVYDVRALELGAQDEIRQAAVETANTSGELATPTPQFTEPKPKEPSVSPEEKAALEAENNRLKLATPTPQFTEPKPKEPSVSPEEKAALEAENNRLKAELAANKTAQIHAANVAFCEGQAGVLPAWRAVAVATLDHLAAQPAVVEFGEGDARAPLAEQFKAMLAALPPAVQFGEAATKDRAAGAADTPASFAAPQGYRVDGADLLTHHKALAYQKANGCSYRDAALAVA